MFGGGGVNKVHSSSVYLPTGSFGCGSSCGRLGGGTEVPTPTAISSGVTSTVNVGHNGWGLGP